MYKEYRFDTVDRAIMKKKEMRKELGFNIPIYRIEPKPGKEFFSIVIPSGLQPNPRTRKR
jgi:hypothetical protein